MSAAVVRDLAGAFTRGCGFASFTIFNSARAIRGILTRGGGAGRGNERGGMFL